MAQYQSFDTIGFHSCDMEIGLKLLSGEIELLPSGNTWDRLGPGSYFWEQDPERSLQYATENAAGNKKTSSKPKLLS